MAGEFPLAEGDIPPHHNQLSRINLEDEASSACEGLITQTPYRSRCHTRRAFESLDAMRKAGLLCDVTLVAGSSRLPVHRSVLSSCSKYFYAMFTSDLSESQQDVIILQDVDESALQLLVDFMYSSEIFVTEENVQILLPAASLLQLNEVRNACGEFLQAQLHPSNCLGIRAFADLHSCRELLASSQGYTEQHFADVVQGEEFMNLGAEAVCDMIASDELTVTSEESVFEAVCAWVSYNKSVRETHMSQLMEHIRLPLLSREYLVQRVEEEPLVKNNSECKDYLIEAMKYHLLASEQRSSLKSPRTRPRTPLGLPKVMYVVGGQAPKAIKAVEMYDFARDSWQQVAELQSRRCRAGVAVLGGLLYAVGGFNGSLRVRTVDVYEPATDAWTTAPSMEARRSTLGAAVLGGCIYAVGGFDGTTGLSSVEKFDPKTQEWRPVANMNTRRSSVGVGVLNGRLYAIGGYDGSSRQCLSSVERYDPSADEWFYVSHMNTRRSGAGVCVLDNKLYAVGGHDGPLVRKSVEVYDAEVDTWTLVSEMCYCRRNAGVAAVNCQLFVVGGDDGASNLHSVEFYNPKTNTWDLLQSAMLQGRSYSGVAVIDRPT